MNILKLKTHLFIERIEGEYALCRLDDREKNLIKLPLRELPKNIKQFSVITMKTDGTFFVNDFAKELRMEKIAKELKCKRFYYNFY